MWDLGCVNPASRLPLVAGSEFMQPRDHLLAEPCTPIMFLRRSRGQLNVLRNSHASKGGGRSSVGFGHLFPLSPSPRSLLTSFLPIPRGKHYFVSRRRRSRTQRPYIVACNCGLVFMSAAACKVRLLLETNFARTTSNFLVQKCLKGRFEVQEGMELYQ